MAIVPVAKAMYICDYHIGLDNGKVDLYGIFNAIRPPKGYPHSLTRFCAFTQLVNGLGDVSFRIDVRAGRTDRLIDFTPTYRLHFPDRRTTLRVAVEMKGCEFPEAGLYLLELHCDNTWVCDAPLELLS